MNLSDKQFDRYLYRKLNQKSAYQGFEDDKLTNAVLEASQRPATQIAPGTVITSTIIQSSGSNNRVEILPDDMLIVYRNGTPVVIIDRDGIETTRTMYANGGLVVNGFRQPTIIGAGFVNADGTPSPTVFPSGWTSTKLSNGRYQITHNLNSLDYAALITPVAGTTREFVVESYGLNSFITRFYNNSTSSLVDTDHSFMVFTNP